MNELSCPKCKVGTVQRSTIYVEGERYNAFGCNKCDYGYWELFVDAKTYTVSTEGTADQFAKDISEMSDEEVEKNVEEHFSPTKGIRWNPREMLGKLYDENVFLKSERERLIKKLESVQDKLKEFLKDLETSPQQVSFEKEVLVKFISEMIEESSGTCKNNEQFLNDIIKEFKVLYPKVEFTLGEPDESGKQNFFANGQNLKIRWSKKLVEDLVAANRINALDELRLMLIEQLSISMSVTKNSNENEKRND